MGATTEGEELYWLPRNDAESQRLDQQHDLLKRTLGYVLHPAILQSIPSDSRIADLATGTGILLRDLAQVLPETCQLDGFDISDTQFPPPKALPNNVQLRLLDAKQPVPEELRGQYDVVTVRYLAAALEHEDCAIVAGNVMNLLKPGGYVQWAEPDVTQSWKLYRGDPGVPISDASLRFAEGLTNSPIEKKLAYVAESLGPTVRDAGFRDVTHDIVSTDRLPSERKTSWRVTCEPLSGLWQAIEAQKGEDGLSAEEVAKAKRQIVEEIESGALYQRYDIHRCVGRKP